MKLNDQATFWLDSWVNPKTNTNEVARANAKAIALHIAALQKELWLVAECIFQNVSAGEMKHWAQGIRVTLQGDGPPRFTVDAAAVTRATSP